MFTILAYSLLYYISIFTPRTNSIIRVLSCLSSIYLEIGSIGVLVVLGRLARWKLHINTRLNCWALWASCYIPTQCTIAYKEAASERQDTTVVLHVPLFRANTCNPEIAWYILGSLISVVLCSQFSKHRVFCFCLQVRSDGGHVSTYTTARIRNQNQCPCSHARRYVQTAASQSSGL